MRAERAAVAEAGAGVALALAYQRRRDVALGVPGGDQDQRHGGEAARALLDQLGDGVGERRRGQLDEAAADRGLRQAGLEQLDELAEGLRAVLVTGAVADQQQRGGGHRFFSSEVSEVVMVS